MDTVPTMTRSRRVRRAIEARIGSRFMEKGLDYCQKAGKLVGPKKVFLPKSRIHMHYYERKATVSKHSERMGQHPQTLLFCHGLADVAHNFGNLIATLKIPRNIRILCPEQIGHGQDLKQSVEDPNHYKEPSHETAEIMLASTCEFLDAVHVGPNCNAFGISMGGALVYYLRLKRPDVIKKTVLVSPAIRFCMHDGFINGILNGTNRFLDYQSRDDVKVMMRDMLSTGPYATDPKAMRRKSKYPIPTFMFEAIYRKHQTKVPAGHFKKLVQAFLETQDVTNDGEDGTNGDKTNSNANNIFTATTDLDPNSPRLVICPEDDQLCSCAKTKHFFDRSIVTAPCAASDGTIYEIIPDCGHVFHLDGRLIYDVVQPRIREYLLDFSLLSSHT